MKKRFFVGVVLLAIAATADVSQTYASQTTEVLEKKAPSLVNVEAVQEPKDEEKSKSAPAHEPAIKVEKVKTVSDNAISLVVNERLIKPDIAPQLMNGRVLVPIRWVAEALGADVKWEEENRNVQIKTPQLDSLQQQVRLLQAAIAPKTPKEAVETWARGVKERNGALQYAVLSPELKEQRLSSYEGFRWVTGTSSPWVERYEITKETSIQGGVWEYEVKLQMMTSTGDAGTSVYKVVVKKYKIDALLPSSLAEGNWYISEIPR